MEIFLINFTIFRPNRPPLLWVPFAPDTLKSYEGFINIDPRTLFVGPEWMEESEPPHPYQGPTPRVREGNINIDPHTRFHTVLSNWSMRYFFVPSVGGSPYNPPDSVWTTWDNPQFWWTDFWMISYGRAGASPSPPLADAQDSGGQGGRTALQGARTARAPPGWRTYDPRSHYALDFGQVIIYRFKLWHLHRAHYLLRDRPKKYLYPRSKKNILSTFFWVDSVAGIFFRHKKVS